MHAMYTYFSEKYFLYRRWFFRIYDVVVGVDIGR